jgi:AcrR family transcriptional regulator
VPRAALRADELADLRRRTAAAASRLHAAGGPDAVTMRAVADALSVSAMTPYRYVSGKDELIALVRADAFARFADALAAALSPATDAITALLRLKRAYVGFAVAEPHAYRAMFELHQPAPTAATPELVEASTRAFEHLHGAVRTAIAAGDLAGDALVVARLLWANTHGLVSLHLAGRLSARALAQLAAVDHELAAFRTPRIRTPRTRTPRTRTTRTRTRTRRSPR